MSTNFPKWKLVAFALLSACDFATTFYVMSHSRGDVYESNPIANSWLQTSGWTGLAVFKSAIVCLVTIIVTCLYYRRPRLAHDLLALGCGAVVVAVMTGANIALSQAGFSLDEPDGVIRKGNPGLIEDERTRAYAGALDYLGTKLVANECTLSEGVEHLRGTELAKDPAWINTLRRAYSEQLTPDALLAADLVQHAVDKVLRTPEGSAVAKRLEDEFRKCYGDLPELPYHRFLETIRALPDDAQPTEHSSHIPAV